MVKFKGFIKNLFTLDNFITGMITLILVFGVKLLVFNIIDHPMDLLFRLFKTFTIFIGVIVLGFCLNKIPFFKDKNQR